jgi:membrane associated rhomboid family serine protease
MTPAPVGLRCPEHSGKPQGVKKVSAAAGRVASGQASRSGTPLTYALIAINVGVYLLELADGGTIDGLGNSIYEKGVLIANGVYADGSLAGVAHGEPWRLITSAFLHYGPIHLGLNMLALYWGGRVLEHVIGSWRFLLLYLAAGLAGSAGALWLSPNDPTVGASGAIFGIFGALLVLERRGTIQSGGQILALIVRNLVISVSLPGISLGGHLGGLVAGIVLMLLYFESRRSAALSIAAAVAVAAVSVIVAYAVI